MRFPGSVLQGVQGGKGHYFRIGCQRVMERLGKQMGIDSDVEIEMYGRMMIALGAIEDCREFAAFIPEVRTNMAYASPGAKTPADVLAIEGRITVVGGMPHAAGRPRFGASGHLARFVLGIMQDHPEIRVAINFSSPPDLIQWLEWYCRQKDWPFAVIDRSEESTGGRNIEGSTMSWKAAEAIRKTGDRAPKIICDRGDFGKEPVSVIVGPEPISTVTELLSIVREYSRS